MIGLANAHETEGEARRGVAAVATSPSLVPWSLLAAEARCWALGTSPWNTVAVAPRHTGRGDGVSGETELIIVRARDGFVAVPEAALPFTLPTGVKLGILAQFGWITRLGLVDLSW